MTSEELLNSGSLDVSDLPSVVFDQRSTLWWANTLGLFIETTMFGILVAI